MALKHKLNFIDLELDQVKQKNLYRKLRYGKVQGSHITINNKKLLNLSSNDYLGIPIRKNQIKQLQSIELNALQDIKPWIWSPKSVVFSTSTDGETFDLLERVESQLSERDEVVQVETFSCNKTIDARFVRVETMSRGMIPEWHLGDGNPRWTFLDEIVVEKLAVTAEKYPVERAKGRSAKYDAL